MMRELQNMKSILSLLIVAFLFASCGTADNGTAAATTATAIGIGGSGVSGSLPASNIIVTKSILTAIPATSSVVITANVTDSYSANVVDGTIVNFTTDIVGTSVTTSSLTVGGVATATFSANNTAGTVIITATSGAVSGFVTIDITPSSPALITTSAVVPSQIGVKGSGLAQKAILTFNVTDAYGNLVTDGSIVNFVIGAGLGGGETVSPSSAGTIGGKVSVTVIAGAKSGLMGVNATVAGTAVTTTGNVVIQGGIGIASNFSIETTQASFEGFDRIGNTNDFTIFLADIFGNPVKAGVQVSFMTETGSIPSTTLNAAGIATVTYTTPGGSDPGGVLKGHPLGTGTGKVGYLTVLAMAKGQEPFSDNNNNGIYDAGDTFTPALHDFGEPFLDANENGVHDVGEHYNDNNLDGVYSGPNGIHDTDATIWNSMVVVLSTKDYTVTAAPTVGATRTNFVVTILDQNSNPIDSSATYAATVKKIAGDGLLGGTESSSVPFSAQFAVPAPALPVQYNLVSGNPTIPIWVPTFNNSTSTNRDNLDRLTISIKAPSKSYSLIDF